MSLRSVLSFIILSLLLMRFCKRDPLVEITLCTKNFDIIIIYSIIFIDIMFSKATRICVPPVIISMREYVFCLLVFYSIDQYEIHHNFSRNNGENSLKAITNYRKLNSYTWVDPSFKLFHISWALYIMNISFLSICISLANAYWIFYAVNAVMCGGI